MSAATNQDELSDHARLARADVPAIRHALATNPEFQLAFFLPDEITLAVPEVHSRTLAEMESAEIAWYLTALPRGFSKTTLAKIATLCEWLHSPMRFAVYLSSTFTLAKNACLDIINHMHKDNFVNVFGRPQFTKESESEGLWIFTLPHNGKKCILRAIGSEQRVRGLNVDNIRPEWAVVDDLEDLDNTVDPKQRNKLFTWFLRTFLKALSRRARVRMIGNMICEDSILERLSNDPEWTARVYGALYADEKGEYRSLWPELWSVDQLITNYLSFVRLGHGASWMAEMMNNPSGGLGLGSLKDIRYEPRPMLSELYATFITIDPAPTHGPNSDQSAIAVHGIWNDDRPPIMLQVVAGRFSDVELFARAVELAQEWRVRYVGIEAVAAQNLYIPYFRVLAQIHRMGQQLEFVPLPLSTKKKNLRIQAWLQLASANPPGYLISSEDVLLTQQLISWNPERENQPDDILDAASMGPAMINAHYIDIMAAAMQEGLLPATRVIGEGKLCNV